MRMKRERIPVRLFVIAAAADAKLQATLEKHLVPLCQQGLLANWQSVQPGENAEEAFAKAKLIILLLSADLHTDRFYQDHIQRTLERQQQGAVQVVPILLRPVDVTGAPFAHLAMVPTNGKAVTQWTNDDAAWTHITEAIRWVLQGRSLPKVPGQLNRRRLTFVFIPLILLLILGVGFLSVRLREASSLTDDFSKDTVLNQNLWTVNGSAALLALSNFDTPPAQVVAPILSFSPTTGMDMGGVNKCFQETGIQSVQDFSPPFTVTAIATPISINGGPIQLMITNAKGESGVNDIGSAPIGSTQYTGFWFAAPTGPNALWVQLGILTQQAPVIGTAYTLTISVNSAGTATVSVHCDGMLLGQGNQYIGPGPFYVVLSQGTGGCPQGPVEAYWQMVQVVS